MGKQRTNRDYTVGWLCALPLSEQVAAEVMLDEKHQPLPRRSGDQNIYTYGSISGHNVVIACMPPGQPGPVSAQRLVQPLRDSFPDMSIHLFVGVGGGVPRMPMPKDPEKDIRLGDVVVGWPDETGAPAVVHWDLHRYHGEGNFTPLVILDKPDRQLVNAVGEMLKNRRMKLNPFHTHLTRFSKIDGFDCPDLDLDKLYQADDPAALVERPHRKDTHPVFHQGTIVSGSAVIQDAKKRDEVRRTYHNAICFEMEAAGIMDQTHCLVIRGIADYADMHKIQGWQDYAAATAAAFARQLLLTIEPLDQDDVGIAAKTEEEERCHQAFRVCEYESQKNRNPKRTMGTCEWFLHHAVYKEWRDGDSAGLLWVSADPGCGKSVLSRYLIDTRFESLDSNPVCYFFFKDDSEDHMKAGLALSSLLHQIFVHKPFLLRYAMVEWRNNGCQLPRLFEVQWGIFENIATDPQSANITCLLDALDECQLPSREILIERLNGLYQPKGDDDKKKPFMRIVVTSRPYKDIEYALDACTIRLAGEEESESISREITMVIKARVPEIASKLRIPPSDPWFRQDLEQHLLAIPHRTYLWLHLIMDWISRRKGDLNDGLSRLKLKKVIDSIPQSVADAYTAILNKCTDEVRARRLLHIILAARRALTLAEMNIAMSAEPDMTSTNELDLELIENFKGTVRSLCGLFINIIDGRVYLIHQTAREFLLSDTSATSEIQHRPWEHSFAIQQCHLVLANICMTYLLFVEFRRRWPEGGLGEDFLNIYSRGTSGSDQRLYKQHSFLSYAVHSWISHFNETCVRDNGSLGLATRLCHTGGPFFGTWIALCDDVGHLCRTCATPLIIAASYGIAKCVNALLDNGALPSSQDCRGWTALRSAVHRSHEGVVRVLLDHGADPNTTDTRGETPLIEAIRQGNEVTVRLLLERGAKLNTANVGGTLALLRAMSAGDYKVVRHLLRHGADPNVANVVGVTGLHMAAYQCEEDCNETILKLLIEKGADISQVSADGRSPLHMAAAFKSIAALEALLARGADLRAQDWSGCTALRAVLDSGEQDSGRFCVMIQMLLDHGAGVDIADSEGITALSTAASRGSQAPALLLLNSGADLAHSDIYGRTALHVAAGAGQTQIVRLLLDRGADISVKDNSKSTALHYGVSSSCVDTVLALLDHGACLESADEFGITPLVQAARCGFTNIEELLSSRGATISAADRWRSNTMQRAVCPENIYLVNLLRSWKSQGTSTVQ